MFLKPKAFCKTKFVHLSNIYFPFGFPRRLTVTSPASVPKSPNARWRITSPKITNCEQLAVKSFVIVLLQSRAELCAFRVLITVLWGATAEIYFAVRSFYPGCQSRNDGVPHLRCTLHKRTRSFRNCRLRLPIAVPWWEISNYEKWQSLILISDCFWSEWVDDELLLEVWIIWNSAKITISKYWVMLYLWISIMMKDKRQESTNEIVGKTIKKR